MRGFTLIFIFLLAVNASNAVAAKKTASKATKPEVFARDVRGDIIEVSPDGKWLITRYNVNEGGSYTGPVESRLWNLRTRKWINLKIHWAMWLSDGRFWSLDENEKDQKDMNYGFPGAMAPVIHLFRPTQPHKPLVFRDGKIQKHDWYVGCALTPDHKRFVVLSHFFIRHYDAKTGQLIKRVRWKNEKRDENYREPKFSPDVRWILAPAKPARVYRAWTGKLVGTASGVQATEWINNDTFISYIEPKPKAGEMYADDADALYFLFSRRTMKPISKLSESAAIKLTTWSSPIRSNFVYSIRYRQQGEMTIYDLVRSRHAPKSKTSN